MSFVARIIPDLLILHLHVYPQSLTMPSVERDHDMLDGEHQDQDESSSSESEQGSPPQPDPDMVELTSEDHARCFIEHEDRLFHSSDAPYPLPVDTYEQERQNLMHKMCHRILGEHYYGPVPEVLVAVPGDVERRVLDLGTGTGKWAMDMGKAFRQSRVTGVDIVPIQTKEPWKNVWFEIEDIRKQLRWGDEAFDLVHARDLSMG
ncbi:hypothetical protein F5887DRAFT_476975 [Amanita rubescens]|nr:hypothetical protein F5887DRAFT_476975 [Amanita rubescens]